MSFLSRFRTAPEVGTDSETEDFVRRRTFSAAQHREDELARSEAERARVEAEEEAAADLAAQTRALRLADDENAATQESNDGSPAQPAMDWEEAVAWLSGKSAEARNFVAHNWNWEQDLRVLQFLVAQPDIDMGVATGIFWLTGATDDFFPWGDDQTPDDPQFQRAVEMVDQLGRRFAAEDFQSARFGFDDCWDCAVLKERLEALYLDQRITWSPANIPIATPGAQPTIDDVPTEERREVKDFLDRHGAD